LIVYKTLYIHPNTLELADIKTSNTENIVPDIKPELEEWRKNCEIEKVINFYEGKEKLSDTDLLSLAESYLDYANYFYKEEEYSIKAQGILAQTSESSFKKLYLL
jgi:hypothetical protein